MILSGYLSINGISYSQEDMSSNQIKVKVKKKNNNYHINTIRKINKVDSNIVNVSLRYFFHFLASINMLKLE